MILIVASYLYVTRAMDYFDLAAEHGGSLAKAFKGTPTRFCVISFTSDWLFPTSDSRAIVHARPVRETDWDRDERVLQEWRARAQTSETPLQAVALGSLVKVASAVRLKRGRIPHREPGMAIVLARAPSTRSQGRSVGRCLTADTSWRRHRAFSWDRGGTNRQ